MDQKGTQGREKPLQDILSQWETGSRSNASPVFQTTMTDKISKEEARLIELDLQIRNLGGQRWVWSGWGLGTGSGRL